MRVYLPATTTVLQRLLDEGRLTGPLTVFTVTPQLREAYELSEDAEELAEQLNGQQVRGQSSYKDLTQTSNSLDVSVAGMVRGARVVATYPRGNTYATELELDTRNLYHLNQLMAGQF